MKHRSALPGYFDYRNAAVKNILATALVATLARLPRCARDDIGEQSKDPSCVADIDDMAGGGVVHWRRVLRVWLGLT